MHGEYQNLTPSLYITGNLRTYPELSLDLDDQTHVDSKPAGQPEHASLNQCQLIAANRPKLMFLALPAGCGDKVSL